MTGMHFGGAMGLHLQSPPQNSIAAGSSVFDFINGACRRAVKSKKSIIKLTKVAALVAITVFCGYFGQRMLQETIYQHYETASNGRNACINNLRQIEGAKALVAFEMRLKPGDPLSSQALIPYMTGGWRDCPAGGTYSINPVGREPQCNFSGHALP